MFQKDVLAESSALTTRRSHSLFEFSLRDRITATIIREEAAESLLPGIQGDAELAALNHVLNRYNAHWWLQHLSSVGADPASYWRKQLVAEIKAATKGKNSTPQRKHSPWWFFRSFITTRVKYELFHLELDPL